MIKTEYRNVVIKGNKVTGESRDTINGTVYDWCNFMGTSDLMKIHMYAGDYRIWNLQDGYGEPGYTPIQGWDWSGIRDSSDEAIAKMVKVAEKLHGNKLWPWEVENAQAH